MRKKLLIFVGIIVFLIVVGAILSSKKGNPDSFTYTIMSGR